MLPDFDSSLRAMAGVIVRVGVNLQPGQPLLVTEPYELQGVHPEAAPLVEAIRAEAAANDLTVIPADPPRLRALAEANDIRGFETLVSGHIRRLEQHLAHGGAFLFLLGSQPQLMAGLPADRLAGFDRIKWRHLGPVIQRLVRGATQWTLAPAPSIPWADAAYADLPSPARLPALWQTVFGALRVGPALDAGPSSNPGLSTSDNPIVDPLDHWRTHLASLALRRDELNAARHCCIRYTGPGTDLAFELPRSHVWCTAQLISKAGVPFVANLPTEEVFTAPHKNSGHGTVQVARPVVHGGAVIDGIELEFRRGRVAAATARTGQDALHLLLATDRGADRIGEVAVLPALMEDRSPTGRGASGGGPSGRQSSSRLFHHTLLDENAANHIALGDAYRFCSRACLPLALNSSQVHLDLPLDARIEFS